jgi:hypothetical protein
MHAKIAGLMLGAGLLVACAGPRSTPAPVAVSTQVAIPASAVPGITLVGRVVTMNDRDEVLPAAKLWIRGGRIAAIARQGEELPVESRGARVIDTGGSIYPGLIDIHNHPEYAVFPLMPVPKPPYEDRYQWRNYDTNYQLRISRPSDALSRDDFYGLGTDVGRYGEAMALAGGTTTLQGGGSGAKLKDGVAYGERYFRKYAEPGCLARNVETENEVNPANSWVDLPGDLPKWNKLVAESQKGPIIVHLAEGKPSRRMTNEFVYAQNSGLMGANFVAVHGVGLKREHFDAMAKAKAKLVWSPLSNFLLYGMTAEVAAAREAGVAISLAPDWAPSGSKSVLGELKVADRVNRHAMGNVFNDADLVRMVTRNPAAALGWQDALGQIAPGFLADLIIVDDRAADAFRNLIETTESRIRATVVRGEALYGDRDLVAAMRGAEAGLEALTLFGKRPKVLAFGCSGVPSTSFADTVSRLTAALRFDAAATQRFMTPEAIAKAFSGEACKSESRPAMPPTANDAERMMRCQFKLPFEPTPLMGLVAEGDADYWKRLQANPNLPDYLKRLNEDYR